MPVRCGVGLLLRKVDRFATWSDCRSSFSVPFSLMVPLREVFSPAHESLKVASAHGAHHIGVVPLNWKKLCEAAAMEIESTLAALPAPLRERAGKLPVTFERRPNAGLQADGIEPDTLGLFTGAEFAEKRQRFPCRRRSFCSWKIFGILRKGMRKVSAKKCGRPFYTN